MSLHRTSGEPDWETIPKDHRTRLQRLAASTNGIVTLPNIISLVGFIFVLYGLFLILNSQYWSGLIMLVAGRLLDIADGMIAEETATKSPLGELVDATIDKIGTVLTIIVLVIANVAPWWIIILLLVPQIIISLVILIKRRKGIKVHPTRAGKISMALVWVGIIGLLLVTAMGDPIPLAILVTLVIVVSALLALYALWQYATGRD